MLYHCIGQDYEGDPYLVTEAIEYLAYFNVLTADARIIIKQIFQVMINCIEGNKAIYSVMLESSVSDITALDYYQVEKLFTFVESFHNPICGYFYTSVGLELMNNESQIARDIMMKGVKRDILVLVVHDSFIVKQCDREWLYNSMLESYHSLMSFYPVIR